MSGMKSTGPIAVVSALLSFVAPLAGAQTTDLIRDQLDTIRESFFELGPFYATPVIRFSSGYDSNALSTSDAQSDIRAMFGPGIQLGLPLGSNTFFTVFQEVDFVYYREQVDLRQIFGITRLGGGWGTRRLLLTVQDELRDEIRRPTSEFDFPVQQRTNDLQAALSVALGWRQRLRFGYSQRSSEIGDGTSDETVVARLNGRRDVANFGVIRDVTAKTQAIAELEYERLDFDEASRSGDSVAAQFGFDFSPTLPGLVVPTSTSAGMSGRFFVGFKHVSPLEQMLVDYTGLVGSADVSYTSPAGHRLRGVYFRDVVPSIFEENWFFTENRVGASFRWQVHSRVSIEPGAVFGRNDYPLPQLVDGVDDVPTLQEIQDEHTSYRLTVEYQLRPAWFIGVTSEYLARRSNIRSFDKDRLQVGFTMSLRP